MLATQFQQVFGHPEPPAESDSDIASHWLLAHEHKEPSQRVRAALKTVSDSGAVATILQQYLSQIRTEVLGLDVHDLTQLHRIRDYFLFPAQYIALTDLEYALLERTINSVIRVKVQSLTNLTPDQHRFILSLGLDTDEVEKLKFSNAVHTKIASFAGVWDRSFINEIDIEDDFSRQELSNLRIQELFDMVIHYPDTVPALHDLKQCMDPSQRSLLITTFINASTERILHAGANTNDIILCYTATIKAFLIIDPRGVLLDNASRPIRRYLREREDTIPTIVNALLNYDPNDPLSKLSDELAVETEKTTNTLSLEWHPDPTDALPDFRKQDIIESLITIFDSKEQFITELIDAFATKMLERRDYDISDILVKLKQLKGKFEENELNNLDVMVRDIADSEEVNTAIHQRNKDISRHLKFVVLSYLYWPELEEREFKIPKLIQEQFDIYTQEFATMKKSRVMKAVNYGVVDLELEFGDMKLMFNVSPDKAAVIQCFDKKASLTLADVCTELEMDPEMATRALKYWKEEGILDERESGFFVIEEQKPRSPPKVFNPSAKFKPYWPYITEMLTNLGPMDATKVQKFLTAVVPKKIKYTETLDDLTAFLRRKVQEGDLVAEGDKFGLTR